MVAGRGGEHPAFGVVADCGSAAGVILGRWIGGKDTRNDAYVPNISMLAPL